MAEPVNITKIPASRVGVIDQRTGLMTRDWYRFFFNLFTLTGGGNNPVTLDEVQLGPPTDNNLSEHQVMQELQGLNLAPAHTPQLPRHRYGSFYDTTDQTAALVNTAYAMTFNTTDLSLGVTLGTPTSRVYVDTANIYNIQFSAQIDTTIATDHLLWIWLRKNGTDVPDSAGQVRTKGNNFATIAAWNYLLSMNAGDYFELMWAVDDTGVYLNSSAASAFHPAIPSVILDARGEADIWYAPGVSYKVVLRTSADALIWTVDNIAMSGSMATQNADNVSITGGTIGSGVTFAGSITGTATNVTGTVAVANGGTGATTAANARTNLGAAASGANTDITSLEQDVAIVATGTIGTDSVGYRGAPQNAQTGAYALTLNDNGKHISITTGGITIPANASVAFPIGATVVIYNNSGSSQTIAITSDTLRQAGTTNTGSRTLAGYGLATVVKVAATVWVISGAGLS